MYKNIVYGQMDGTTNEQKSSRELSAKLLLEPGEGAYGA